jgi:hypothetical protein
VNAAGTRVAGVDIIRCDGVFVGSSSLPTIAVENQKQRLSIDKVW